MILRSGKGVAMSTGEPSNVFAESDSDESARNPVSPSLLISDITEEGEEQLTRPERAISPGRGRIREEAGGFREMMKMFMVEMNANMANLTESMNRNIAEIKEENASFKKNSDKSMAEIAKRMDKKFEMINESNADMKREIIAAVEKSLKKSFEKHEAEIMKEDSVKDSVNESFIGEEQRKVGTLIEIEENSEEESVNESLINDEQKSGEILIGRVESKDDLTRNEGVVLQKNNEQMFSVTRVVDSAETELEIDGGYDPNKYGNLMNQEKGTNNEYKPQNTSYVAHKLEKSNENKYDPKMYRMLYTIHWTKSSIGHNMNVPFGQNQICMGAKNEVKFVILAQIAAKKGGTMREIFESHAIGPWRQYLTGGQS